MSTDATRASTLSPAMNENSRLAEMLEELKDQVGGISPYPNAGIDGFLSHFIIMVEFTAGDMKGRYATITMPVAVQTVSRSSPFIYKGTDAKLWCASYTGTEWTQAAIGTSANVSDWLTFFPKYGYVCYKGTDNQIWRIHWNGSSCPSWRPDTSNLTATVNGR